MILIPFPLMDQKSWVVQGKCQYIALRRYNSFFLSIILMWSFIASWGKDTSPSNLGTTRLDLSFLVVINNFNTI